MRVYVANPPLQHRDFHYRIPGVQTSRVLRIRAGGQELLPESLDGSDLQSVLQQLQGIGAVPKSDLASIVAPKALIFDVAPNPIKAETIEEGLGLDEDARQEVSAAKMEESGLQAFARAQSGGARAVEASMEVVEVTDRGAVKGGVNYEVVVSSKPNRRAARKRTETKA